MKPQLITKEKAYKAVMAVNNPDDDPESEHYGKTIIHCFLGAFGADWDKDAVLKKIGEGEKFAFVDNIFDHNLAVQTKDHVYNFDIRRSKGE